MKQCAHEGCKFLGIYAPRVRFFAVRELDPDGKHPIVLHAALEMCAQHSGNFKLGDFGLGPDGTTVVDLVTRICEANHRAIPDWTRTQVDRVLVDSNEYRQFKAQCEKAKQ